MPTRDGAWPQGTPSWVDLAVDDVAMAAAFYQGLFGWSALDAGSAGGDYVVMSKGGRPVAGIGPQASAGRPATWSTYFASDDADATAERVRRAGGQVHMDPFDVGTAGRMFVATAPDGATFGVWQAGESKGVGVYNEDGSLCWNELHSSDLTLAQAFFTEVFGFTYVGLPSPDFTYFLFRREGETDPDRRHEPERDVSSRASVALAHLVRQRRPRLRLSSRTRARGGDPDGAQRQHLRAVGGRTRHPGGDLRPHRPPVVHVVRVTSRPSARRHEAWRHVVRPVGVLIGASPPTSRGIPGILTQQLWSRPP